MEQFAKDIVQFIDDRKEKTWEISDHVWGYAESRFSEFKSSKEESEYMESLGFKVTRGIGGEDTAFVAEFGRGKPIIGILGEYDALSGLSQEADVAERKEIIPGGDGHGCGHNLLGMASIAATVGLKDYMEKNGVKGTIRFYGCPAEENAGGKAFLVREGCFDDVDICISWHPGTTNAVNRGSSLANFRIFYTFHGLSSHAAGAPHLGRSALDAVELMDVGVNYMREHMIDEARIHYAIINSGGTAPNVVQSEAQVLYAIRAPKVTDVVELAERVSNCARGAALMTGTTVDIRHVAAYSNLIPNDVIGDVLDKYLHEFIPMDLTEEDLAYAKKFTEVITPLDRAALENQAKALVGKGWKEFLDANPVLNFVIDGRLLKGGGSTDVGDVSWVVPTSQIGTSTLAAGTPGHAWQVVAQGKGPVAHKAMIAASKVMACAAYEFLTTPKLVEEATEEWKDRLGGETYPNPLPKEMKPEIW
ncbi:MAG: amidohydrolase [Firmicutes bacterium]|nr:amidohydrolase [Bacillota bacterium]